MTKTTIKSEINEIANVRTCEGFNLSFYLKINELVSIQFELIISSQIILYYTVTYNIEERNYKTDISLLVTECQIYCVEDVKRKYINKMLDVDEDLENFLFKKSLFIEKVKKIENTTLPYYMREVDFLLYAKTTEIKTIEDVIKEYFRESKSIEVMDRSRITVVYNRNFLIFSIYKVNSNFKLNIKMIGSMGDIQNKLDSFIGHLSNYYFIINDYFLDSQHNYFIEEK